MWFTTGDNEQKAKNLEANQHCALTTGTDTLTGTDYVIEGVARLVTEEATRETLGIAFEETYGWQFAREDATWYGLSDAIRTGTVQLYRVGFRLHNRMRVIPDSLSVAPIGARPTSGR